MASKYSEEAQKGNSAWGVLNQLDNASNKGRDE